MDKKELTQLEKIELQKFMRDNAKEIGDVEGRKNFFREAATDEILHLRAENEKLAAEGKDPITTADRRMTLRSGVVKSHWRAKENDKMRHAQIKESIHIANSTYRDA